MWRKADYPWSLRLKEILRLWLPWIKAKYHTTSEMDEKLVSISASTIDRALRDKKRKLTHRLDPFQLAETINWKLERIRDLAHYRYKPEDKNKGAQDVKEQLSSEEKETLEGIAQTLGIDVYVRIHRNGELIIIEDF